MENIWIIFALISAFSLATSDAFTKKSLKDHNEYIIAWLRLLFSLPLLITACFFIPMPELNRDFYIIFIIALPLEIASIILYIKALKLSPMSLTLPFLSLTPLFLIIISYILLGESVSSAGAAGIILIVAGSYILNIKDIKKGFFEPFIAISKEKGAVYMIAVAMIYSVTASLGKAAIELSSPVFFGSVFFTAVAIGFTPVALYKGKPKASSLNMQVFKSAVVPGLFYSLMIISHVIALSMTNVAYMISVKRLSLLIGVLYGYYLFKESGIKERFIGSVLMLIGFLLIIHCE